MPDYPPPPTGSEKYGDEIPSSISAAWDSLSGPERVWLSFRDKSFLLQVLAWLFLFPVFAGLWVVKNLTSKTASTGLKVVSGIIGALIVLSLFA